MDNNLEQREGAPRSANTSPSRISTALVSDSTSLGDVLHRSRITNLPNYRRTDLGDNIQFIVVFQTMEIERLSHQIQHLRVKFREAQRQLFNAENCEVQVRELTQKCFHYESLIQQLRGQYEKLNKICEGLYQQNEGLKSELSVMDLSLRQKYETERQRGGELLQEMERWKTRCLAAERGRDVELEQLRTMMEAQRKSIISRELREMTIRFESERSNFEHEISRYLERLEHCGVEIEEGKEKLERYEGELVELRLLQPMIGEYEHRVGVLCSEVLHLTELLQSKQGELQTLFKTESELMAKLQQRNEWGRENMLLRGTVEEKNRQIQQNRLRTCKLQEQAIRGKEMLHYNNELTGKLDLASKELERMNNLLRIKVEQVQRWKFKLSAKEEELAVLEDLGNELAQQQAMTNMVRTENDRLHAMLTARMEDIEGWKRRSADLEAALSKFSSLEKEKMLLEDRFSSQMRDAEQLRLLLGQLQADNKALRKFQQRCRDIECKNELHLKQIERLCVAMQGKEHELMGYSQKLSRYEEDMNEYRHVQILMKDNATRNVMMEQEMGRLNALIRAKNDQIEGLENQLAQSHSSLAKYSNFQLKIYENEQTFGKLQGTIEAAQKEIEVWQGKSRVAEARVKELQNGVYVRSEQKQKVAVALRAKTVQCEELKVKVWGMESELKKSVELQLLCEQLHKQSMIHLNDLQNMEKRALQSEDLLKKERAVSQQLKGKLGVAAAELQRLTKELRANETSRIQELCDLQKNYDKLDTCLQAKDSEIDVLTNKMAQLQAQCAAIMVEFNRLLEAAMESFEESVALGQKIQEYEDYGSHIQILNSEIDRLGQLNSALELDIKDMRLKYASTAITEKRGQTSDLVLVLMGAQMQSLRGRLQQREASLQQMRRSILQPIRKLK